MAKILIVDDEARIREMIKKYAIYDGHTCDEADSGEMAIDLALNKDYDIIIMDVMMGEVDGFTACKTIKNKNNNIPVLISLFRMMAFLFLCLSLSLISSPDFISSHPK